MKRMRKLKGRAGFSLAETLLAVLILLLVTTIVASGVPVARNAFEKVVRASNAQALLSTTVSALRDELGTAWDVQLDPTDTNKLTLKFISADTGARSRLTFDAAKKQIVLNEYIDVADLGIDVKTGEANDRPLVSEATATGGFYVKYDEAVPNADSGTVTFTNLKVYDKNTNAELARLGDDAGKSDDLVVQVFRTGGNTLTRPNAFS